MSQFGEEFINTELNTDGVKEGAKEINETLENTAKDAAKTASEMNDSISEAIEDASQNAQASFDEISQGAEDAAEVVNNAFDNSGQEVNEALDGAADSLPESINEAVQKSKGFIQDFIDGFKEGFSEVINTEGAVDLTEGVEESMEQTASKTQSLKDRIVDALDQIALKFYQSDSPRGEMMGNTFNALAGTVENFGNTTKKVFAGIAKGAGSVALAGVKKLASGIKTLVVNGARLAKSGIITGLKKIGELARQGAKRVLGIGKNATKMGGGFGSSLKQMVKFGLGISSLFILFNKLRSAITDGMKNLAQYDKETNASISSVKNALATLKNALATAFAPILNVIAPIITSFINKLTELANTIGMVIAKLTGKGTFTKAIAAQNDYAASLDKTGKSAGKASKAIASFDKLNVLNSNSDSGSGGGGSADMFETVPIDEQASDFANRLKAMWENADFTELGTMLGAKLAQALDNIPWGEIQSVAGKLGKSLATLINGFVEFPDLGYKIGNAIAQAFNTALEFANQFVKNLHWDSLGKFIGDGINGLFLNIDWNKLGETIALGFNGIGETLLYTAQTIKYEDIGTAVGQGLDTAIQNVDFTVWADGLSEGLKGSFDSMTAGLNEVDWQTLGEKVADYFETIDYAGIAQSFYTLLGTALGSGVEFIWGFLEDAVIGIRDYFKGYIDQYIAISGEENLGYAIIAGILHGIINAIAKIGQWIYDNMFTPFIEGFKNAFKIHSPSQVMFEMGGYILDGLFNGLKGLWDKVKSIFVKFKLNVKLKVEEIKKNAEEKFITMKNNIKTTVDNMKTAVLNTFNALKNGLKTPINAILGFVETFANGIVRAVNRVINALNNLQIDVPDWVTDKFGISSFGFSIPTLSEVSIPRLATGTVIPPNKEFMAILGDQKHGTNIEAPLDTIVDAFNKAGGNRTDEELALLRQQNDLLSQILYKGLSISSRDVFNSVRSEARDFYARTGNEAFI